MMYTINPAIPKLRLVRANVRFDLACKLRKTNDFAATRTLLEGCIQDYEAELGPDAKELQVRICPRVLRLIGPP
eukprot:6025996-Pyramimonas_sp.AAC.2